MPEAGSSKLVEDSRIPVMILTGFLGAGKTTLLNHLLTGDHGKRFAIIENEYGKVGIDEKICIKEKVEDDLIEVVNGCMCCTVRSDLVETLLKLADKLEDFDCVIVETTGLADPFPVAQIFHTDEEVKDFYQLDSIITVVDAKHILLRLDDEGDVASEQLAFADRVLLNKIDLVPEEKELLNIENRIHSINSEVPIIRCTNSQVDWQQCLNLNAFNLGKVLDFKPTFLTDMEAKHEHDSSVGSVSVKFEGDLKVHELNDWIYELLEDKGHDLFRYKGVLSVKDEIEKYVFQGVGMLFKGGYSEIKWESNEVRESRVVFIGRDLDKKGLIDGILACREMPKKRKVGEAEPGLEVYGLEKDHDHDHDHGHDEHKHGHGHKKDKGHGHGHEAHDQPKTTASDLLNPGERPAKKLKTAESTE